MAVQEYCAQRGEAEENNAEDGVHETKEDRTDPVGDEANDDDQRREPGHETGGDHQDSPPGGAGAQD